MRRHSYDIQIVCQCVNGMQCSKKKRDRLGGVEYLGTGEIAKGPAAD